MIRPTFVSDEMQRRFSVDGVVAFPLLSAERASTLCEEVLQLHTGSRSGWHSSNESRDHDYRRRVHDALTEVFTEPMAEVLDDHRLFNTSILIKWPGPDTAMGTHQDWTFVDETRFRSVTVWCPLVDVEPLNGALEVLAGSHRVLTHSRCSPSLPEAYEDPLAGLGPDALDPWPLPAGTAIALDHAVAHRSPPNHTAAPRIAIAGAFAPSEAVLRHHYRDPGGRIWAFDIPDAAWFRTCDIGQRPRDVPCRGQSDFTAEKLSSEELLIRCRTPEPRPSGRRHRGSSPPPGSRSAGFWRSLRGRRRRQGEPVEDAVDARPPTFLANALEGQFREQGYLVVDLLDPVACAELRIAYEHLDHGDQWDSEFAPGFHTTMYDSRLDYRRQVCSLIEHAMSSTLDTLLVDHRICLANFTVKQPAGEPVPGHVDWSFVDEAGASSATVWCALEDISEEQGALTVIPGSHRQVDFIRPVNVRDYDRHSSVAGGEQVAVPVRVGQAVVLDNRTVHGSSANRSDRTRVAAAAVVAPRAVPLHHYWIDGDDELVQLEIEPQFFLHYQIGQDPTSTTGVLDRRVVRGVEFA